MESRPLHPFRFQDVPRAVGAGPLIVETLAEGVGFQMETFPQVSPREEPVGTLVPEVARATGMSVTP